MENKIIDLSVSMEENNGEIAAFKFKQIDHKKGGNIFGKKFAFSKKRNLYERIISILSYLLGRERITGDIFQDGEFINTEFITASTHTGTHFDAPFHFGSHSEGKTAMTVDEIPLEWCFSDGVILDLSFKKQGEFIQTQDIQNELNRIKYKIKPLDIVLIKTGADKYWGSEEYLMKYPGMSKEATEYLVNQGVKIIGIDSYGFDRPFAYMMNDYFKTKDNTQLFPAHFFGRQKTYCHIERMKNLDKISISYGFKVACFPIKIKGAGAAWTRVVAIL